MSCPLVSVCFVTYNHANFVGEALNSALKQDYPNLEVVVADDGSTDGSVDILCDYARKYPDRLVLFPSRPNQGIHGIADNYNRALKACKGKYIVFLDGDDVFLPGKITKQVNWLEQDERRVLCGHDVEFFDSKTGKRLYLFSERFPMRSGQGALTVVRHNVPFCLVSIMVRASSMPLHGFDEHLCIILDWKLWIDCLASGGHFGYVDGVYSRYRRHENNVTSLHFETCQRDQFLTLALVESLYPHLVESCRYGRASLFYGMGLRCLLRGEKKQARVHLMNAVRQHFHWKAYWELLLTFLPDKVVASLFAKLTRKTLV